MYTGSDSAISRAELAYGELKQRLLAGDFCLGERLAEERLAAMLGVSRTPVREALSRLNLEGVVERMPDGGHCPTAPDLAVIGELYEVRRGLELLAMRRPAHTLDGHDPDRLKALRADWESLEVAEVEPGPDPSFVVLDEDFHVRLAEAAGNHALVVLLQGINERIRLVRVHDFLTPERVARTIEQHLAIVEAISVGDHGEAERRLDRHLTESFAIVEGRAAVSLARMLSKPGPT